MKLRWYDESLIAAAYAAVLISVVLWAWGATSS